MKALGKTPSTPCRLHALGYLALAAAVAGIAAWRSVSTSGGELTPPLDDTYIYLQYARGGSLLEYQAGDEATRGATSLLYPVLLAPLVRLAGPDHAMAVAWGLGVILLAGIALSTHWSTAALTGRGAAGGMAGLLVLSNGHLVWGTAAGMDLALFSLTMMAALAGSAWYLNAPRGQPAAGRFALVATLLFLAALARPEGILVAAVTAGGLLAAGDAPHSRRTRALFLLAPLLAAAVTAAVTYAALGHLRSNSLEAKAIWSEQRPDVRLQAFRNLPPRLVGIVTAFFTDFGSRVYGRGTAALLPLLLATGAALAVTGAWVRRDRRTLTLIAAGMLAAGWATGLVPAVADSHYFRYQIPYVPLLIMIVIGGWSLVLDSPRRITAMGTVILVLFLPGLVRFIDLYGRNAGNIHDQQIAMGRWIDEHLPPEAIVGVNDAGAIAYFGNRPIVDLVGLVTNGAALPHRAGPGSRYEWLEHLEASRRPTHFALFPRWFPYLRRTSLMGRKLVEFRLLNNTISGDDVKVLREAVWTAVGRDSLPVLRRPLIDDWGFSLSDALDVADLESERRHEYRVFDTWRSILRERPSGDPASAQAIDGGRQPTKGESFTMSCRPGEAGALIMRTEAYFPMRLEVTVNGVEVGSFVQERAELVWSEPMVELPGEVLTGERVEISVVSADTSYTSYHYWLIQ